MKIGLTRRHYGLHELVKEAEIPGELDDYATLLTVSRIHPDEYAVDEDKLLAALPKDFLPVPARRVLLMVGDEDGATGQSGLSKFRNWAKYFDAYALTIYKPEQVSPTDAYLSSVYRQLDDYLGPDEAPYDVEAGLERLMTWMHGEGPEAAR